MNYFENDILKSKSICEINNIMLSISKQKRETKFIEHYNRFPEPYRSQAIENFKKYPTAFKNIAGTIKIALCLGFDWNKTSQGYLYWENFKNSLI